MSFREAWRALWRAERKDAPVVAVSGLGQPRTLPDRYEALAAEGYQQNVIVFRCVRLLSKAIAAVPFSLFRGTERIARHALLELLETPAPTKGRVELFTALSAYWLLAGNAFLVKLGPSNAPPRELWPLRPDRLRIKASGREIPEAYEYMVEGRVQARYPVNARTGASAVKHFKTWHPLDDHYGLSPLQAAAWGTDQHNAANRHNLALLQNSGRPSGAVVFRPQDESGQLVPLTDEQRAILKQDLDAKLKGPDNAGRILLLEGDFNWTQMGLSPGDMDWAGLKNMSAGEIAMAYDIPPQLVNVEGSLTFANFEQARLSMYEEAVIPILHRFESDLNEWLVPEFGEGLRLKYDIDAIPALAGRKRAQMEKNVGFVQAGVMTINEARADVGLGEIDGGDRALVPSKMRPLGGVTESAQEAPTP